MDRALTDGERKIARSVYRDAIDLDAVLIRRRRWFPFQPRDTVMAPCGHIHFHPHAPVYREDFSREALGLRGLLVHELCHVWQAQRKGRLYLPLMRHPFCRYRYTLRPDWPLERYGLEQQAEIVRHAYLLREGHPAAARGPAEAYERLLRAFG